MTRNQKTNSSLGVSVANVHGLQEKESIFSRKILRSIEFTGLIKQIDNDQM